MIAIEWNLGSSLFIYAAKVHCSCCSLPHLADLHIRYYQIFSDIRYLNIRYYQIFSTNNLGYNNTNKILMAVLSSWILLRVNWKEGQKIWSSPILKYITLYWEWGEGQEHDTRFLRVSNQLKSHRMRMCRNRTFHINIITQLSSSILGIRQSKK